MPCSPPPALPPARLPLLQLVTYFTDCSEPTAADRCVRLLNYTDAAMVQHLVDAWPDYFVFSFSRNVLRRAISQYQVRSRQRGGCRPGGRQPRAASCRPRQGWAGVGGSCVWRAAGCGMARAGCRRQGSAWRLAICLPSGRLHAAAAATMLP